MTARRRCLVAVLATAGLMSAASAHATTYYYCYLENAYGPEGYVYTPVMATSLESMDDQNTGFKFADFASKFVTNDIGGGMHTNCPSYSKLDVARRDQANWVEAHGGREVAWDDSPLPSEPVEESPVTDSLVIEKSKPVVEDPAVMAARALAEERRHASAMARSVAERMRRDAELDAALQESLRRAKRRGRMQ